MKQAVVFIHGIGEQKPMSTLRSFVSAVLPPAAKGKQQYRSKPDRMSELFELRRLTSTGRSSTHFYEYYWAYHVDGTTWWHLLQWFKGLLFRRPSDVPPGLKTIWWMTWMALVGLGPLTVLGYGAYVAEWVAALPHFGAGLDHRRSVAVAAPSARLVLGGRCCSLPESLSLEHRLAPADSRRRPAPVAAPAPVT